MVSIDTIYDILYIVIPSLLIVFMFYLESKYVTEHERENKEYFKIFFLSSFLLGILQYGYRFYFNITESNNGSSGGGSNNVVTDSIKNIKENIKKVPKIEPSKVTTKTIVNDTVKSIVDKVATNVVNVSPDITNNIVKTVSSPKILTSGVKNISKIKHQINPNLPDF